jgi:hypothetical protein
MCEGECTIECLNINRNCTLYKSIQKQFKWFKWTWFYFLKYYYSNLWIINVQSPINLPKSMWKLVFNVANVIFGFENPERKTHKVFKILPYLKLSKNMFLQQKNWKTNNNCNSYGLMKIWLNFNYSKSLTIKWLKFSK